MSPVLIGIIGFIVLFSLLALGVPIGAGMALVGFFGLWFLISDVAAFTKLAVVPFQTVTDYSLAVLPLFILMGQLAFNAGIGRRLYDTAYKFLGSTRGGLAMATVSACTAFGAVCGSSPATAATMATVGLPEMKRYGYADELSAGSVASGGGLGMIMPPSVVLIVYGILTEQSIGALFVAGILPAWTFGPLLASAAAGTLQTTLPEYSLSIWHGFNPALAMSVSVARSVRTSTSVKPLLVSVSVAVLPPAPELRNADDHEVPPLFVNHMPVRVAA